MDYNSEFFRPFPKYEDVFYDDIENHKKYFLPICSINLKFMFPERDEWFHFISVKEAYEGCVGENTEKFHTQFTQRDMFGFDVIDGKYKFDTTWDFFYINQNNDLKEAYQENEESFNAVKAYYDKHKELFLASLRFTEPTLEAFERKIKEREYFPNIAPEYFGFLNDIKHQSLETREFMQKYNVSIEEMNTFEDTNLYCVPKDDAGKVFEYIGYLNAFNFHKYGCDCLMLFHNAKLKKAVVCFEHG